MNTKASKRIASQTWNNLNCVLMKQFERYFVAHELCPQEKLEILNIKAKSLELEDDEFVNTEVANGFYSLAVLNYAHDNFSAAAYFAERTLSVREKLTDSDNDLLHDYHVLVNAYLSKGDYEMAEDATLRWLRLAEDKLGEKDVYHSQILMMMARIYQAQRRLLQAEEMIMRAIALHANIDCMQCEEMTNIKKTYAEFLRKANRLTEATLWDESPQE